MNVLLALSIAIAMGLLFSRFIRFIHLPNVTAYLLAGLVVGPYVLGVFTPGNEQPDGNHQRCGAGLHRVFHRQRI